MRDHSTAIRNESGPAAPRLELEQEEKAILCTLLYYHIFRFPLKAEEIVRFCRCPIVDTTDFGRRLERLVDRRLIAHRDPYYFVGDLADVEARVENEARALAIRPTALSRSRLIARFPFVSAVAVTGTLSKGVMKAGDDLDFMVFTEPGRLWITRCLLMTFKKVFLLNSHRTFCVNYLLSSNNLSIPDHDLFTATEIAWMEPTSNGRIYDRFIDHNRWIEAFFPNWSPVPSAEVPLPRPTFARRAAEGVLDRLGGDRLDTLCQTLITRRNRRKYASMVGSTFDFALRSDRDASKHHPRAFRDRTLEAFADNLRAFEQEHGLMLGKPELAPE